MAKKKEIDIIDSVMEEAFESIHNPNMVIALSQPDITDYERGMVAGKIAMLQHIATLFNPPKKEKENQEDETYLDGQTLDS